MGDDENTNIRKIFNDEGLNGHIWIPKVKEHLKLDNIVLLKHVEEGEFEEFVCQIEKPTEQRALRVIFKIIKSRKQHPEEDQAKSLLEKEMDSAKADSTNILSKVTEELKAHRTDSPDKTMSNKKETMQSNVDNMTPSSSVSAGTKENWTASEAVRKIEAGILCKGFSFTGNLSDIVFGKEAVINVKDSLEYKGNFSKQTTFHEKFSSQEMTDRFERDIDRLSSSWAISAQAGYMGVAKGGFQKANVKEDVMNRQEEKQSSYFSVVYCDKAAVKSVDITAEDVELTSDVTESLQNIEKTVKECNYEAEAHFHEFFETFGSHVGIGEIELGGVLVSTAYCKSFQEEERSKVEGIVSEASELSLSVGFSKAGLEMGLGTSFNATKLHAKSSKNYDSKDLQTTSVELSKIGGPLEIDDKTEWKKELVKYSSHWRIISRNSPPKPIWELLKNHKHDFEDLRRLTEAMERDWENAQDEDKYSRMIQVRKWVRKSNCDEENVVSQANDLHQLRKNYPNDRLWQEEVLYSIEVQRVLTRIVKYLPTEILSRDRVKSSLRSVLKRYEQILRISFFNIEEIIRCIEDPETDIVLGSFKVENVEKLIKVLKEELGDVDIQNPSYDLQVIKKKLQLLMKYWCEKYHDQPPYILTVTLLTSFGFSVTGFHFDYNFSLSEIKNLLERLIETYSIFQDLEDNLKKQAYIVNLALNCPQYQRQEAIKFVVRSMGESLSGKIRKSCQKALRDDDTYNIEKLTESVTDQLGEQQFELIIRSLEAQLEFLEPEIATTRKETVCSHEAGDPDLNEEVTKILKELGLTKYYPQKLTFQDVTMITADVLDDIKMKPTAMPELPWYFIKHILALDSDTRENSRVKIDVTADENEGGESATESATETDTDSDSNDNDSNDSDSNDSDSNDSDSSYYEALLYSVDNKIHPLDLIYVIFLCADDFLRQELVDKMAKCQYAIPCILPPAEHSTSPEKSVLFIWALQTISRVFKKHGIAKHATLAKEETPLITSLSLGEETSWQSRFLNKMLSPQQETFWNQTLQGGDCEQRVSEGMVEVAWYLPGGFDNDKSKIPLAFANMRGNAMHCPTVTDMFMDSSTATLVFTQDIKTAKQFLSKRKSLENVIVIALCRGNNVKKVESASKKLRGKFRLKEHQVICKIAEDSNFSTVLEKLGRSIAEVIKDGQSTSLAEIASRMRTDGCLETDDHLSTAARESAEKILNDIDEIHDIHDRQYGTAKRKILPLQCDVHTRQELAALDKELCRLEECPRNKTIKKYRSEIKKKKWKLQFQQLQNPMSDSFKYFLKCLLSLDSTDRKYFLQCLRLGLNERSTRDLYPLYEQFRECRKAPESAERDEELKHIDEQLRYGSLGLEHFFREMALIYEYIAALKDQVKCEVFDKKLNCLAAVMADIWLEGTAIEIMDGDAVHVPLVWLQAVLNQIEGANVSRVLKVAVLGAQSCGKSSLLNTVFALNFPVSSGRCTRGAYAQLVKVEEKFRETMKCEYVMVVDSEGLMSRVKKSSPNFDNELSTFVAGLSDITLAIFKGEGTEMNDILPLAIHVFLRMNVVAENQSCYFVHQNMGAVGEVAVLDTEIHSLVNELDEKTYAAAVDAGKNHKYKKFSDVLQYDSINDNLYVSGLLNGSQSMGKIDVQYSNKMQQLKYDIIRRKHLDNLKMCGTFTDFAKRVNELWEAIKYEKFVTSFRNVLAIEVHRKMQRVFDDAEWEIKKDIRAKIKEETNINENDMKDPHRKKTIPQMIKKSTKNLDEHLANKIAHMKERIQHYFDCNGCDDCKSGNIQRRHLLADHQKEFQDDIRSLKKTLSKEVNNAMDVLKVKLQANERIDNMSNKMDQVLKERVQKEILKRQSIKSPQEQIELIFNELWAEATGDILKEARDKVEKDPDIEAEVQSVIKRILGKESHEYMQAITRENQEIREDRQFVVDKTIHLRSKAMMSKWFSVDYVSDSDAQYLEDLTNTTIVQAMKNLSKCGEKQFNETDTETLFSEILQTINNNFEITPRYKADMLRYAENMAVPVFMKMHRLYRENSSPEALLERKKKSYQKRFEVEMGEGDAAAEFCENVIKEMLRLNVEESLSCTDLLYELRTRMGEVFKDIRTLEASIMIDLFNQKECKKYYIYINYYKMFVKEKITEKFLEYFGQQDRYKKAAREKLEKITTNVLEGLDNAVGSACEGTQLITTFFSNMKRLKIQHENASGLKELNVKDKGQFGRIVREKIQRTIKNDIISMIDSWNIEEKLIEKDLAGFIFSEIVGCSERCPFCRVQCDAHTGSRKGGNHSATFHRSPGLKGFSNVEDNRLITYDCPFLVDSGHLFRNKDTKGDWLTMNEYYKIYPNWTIKPNANPFVAKYWKWVFAQHNRMFAGYYKAKEAEIPGEWYKYERHEIIEEIQQKYDTTYV